MSSSEPKISVVIDAKNTDNTDKNQHSLMDPAKEKQAHFSEKIYMFPEAYNALRRELSTHWPALWQVTQWRMAYKAEEFVEQMNAALDMNIVFDSAKVSWICEQYLAALEKRRNAKGFGFNTSTDSTELPAQEIILPVITSSKRPD